ncbi:hypothetical protein RIF29_10122 [Crotalaria pallida]|uniref:Uncharacterized protein n=1 Tax=Crotalaria pallida TaxID=3830 RepID=A0AAN9FSL0_CROPI
MAAHGFEESTPSIDGPQDEIALGKDDDGETSRSLEYCCRQNELHKWCTDVVGTGSNTVSYEEKVQYEERKNSTVVDGMKRTSIDNEEMTTQAASSSRTRGECKRDKKLHPLAFNRKV